MDSFLTIFAVIIFLALCITFLTSLSKLLKAFTVIKRYRIDLFDSSVEQINIDKEPTLPPQGYPEKRFWFKGAVLPSLFLSVIFYVSFKHFLELPTSNEVFISWVQDVVYASNKWLKENFYGIGIYTINDFIPLTCGLTLSIVYWVYTNALSKLEYYASHKLFLFAIHQKNQLLDGTILSNLNDALQSTSDKATEFISHLSSFNQVLANEKQAHTELLNDIDKKLMRMYEALAELTSFSASLPRDLCESVRQSFNIGENHMESQMTSFDERLSQINDTIDEYNKFSQNLAQDLSRSIRRAFGESAVYIEEHINSLSVELFTNNLSQILNDASSAMVETARGLNTTSSTIRIVAEEIVELSKTYVWFNDTAVAVAAQLKSASNEFCVTVQPFNKMIYQINSEMTQSTIYVQQMAFTVIQAVADAIEDKIKREVEPREEWLIEFLCSLSDVIGEKFKDTNVTVQEQIEQYVNSNIDIFIEKMNLIMTESCKQQVFLIEKLYKDKSALSAIEYISELRKAQL